MGPKASYILGFSVLYFVLAVVVLFPVFLPNGIGVPFGVHEQTVTLIEKSAVEEAAHFMSDRELLWDGPEPTGYPEYVKFHSIRGGAALPAVLSILSCESEPPVTGSVQTDHINSRLAFEGPCPQRNLMDVGPGPLNFTLSADFSADMHIYKLIMGPMGMLHFFPSVHDDAVYSFNFSGGMEEEVEGWLEPGAYAFEVVSGDMCPSDNDYSPNVTLFNITHWMTAPTYDLSSCVRPCNFSSFEENCNLGEPENVQENDDRPGRPTRPTPPHLCEKVCPMETLQFPHFAVEIVTPSIDDACSTALALFGMRINWLLVVVVVIAGYALFMGGLYGIAKGAAKCSSKSGAYVALGTAQHANAIVEQQIKETRVFPFTFVLQVLFLLLLWVTLGSGHQYVSLAAAVGILVTLIPTVMYMRGNNIIRTLKLWPLCLFGAAAIATLMVIYGAYVYYTEVGWVSNVGLVSVGVAILLYFSTLLNLVDYNRAVGAYRATTEAPPPLSGFLAAALDQLP